ncbi:GNAT family N-acetyltransferase [Pleomorphomonas sp. PLEO]|uniref:GNAT family N-acetyltransferase n=1 Tax=Pleomorphomonas sp. PLEO TaxID=3239306 RepID=UPI00351ED17E
MTDALHAIAEEAPDQPDVVALIEASDIYGAERYPAEGNFATDLAGLKAADITFLVARRGGAAEGCGAAKWFADGAAELKRIFVSERARGSGLGRRIMARLEALAAERRIKTLYLETGPLNTEAVAMYRRLGYVECGPFADYAANPYSLFMTKKLTDKPSNEG